MMGRGAAAAKAGGGGKHPGHPARELAPDEEDPEGLGSLKSVVRLLSVNKETPVGMVVGQDGPRRDTHSRDPLQQQQEQQRGYEGGADDARLEAFAGGDHAVNGDDDDDASDGYATASLEEISALLLDTALGQKAGGFKEGGGLAQGPFESQEASSSKRQRRRKGRDDDPLPGEGRVLASTTRQHHETKSLRILSSVDDAQLSQQLPVLFRAGSVVHTIPKPAACAHAVVEEAKVIAGKAGLEPGPLSMDVLVRGLIRHRKLQVAYAVLHIMRTPSQKWPPPRGWWDHPRPAQGDGVRPRKALYITLLWEFGKRADRPRMYALLNAMADDAHQPCVEVLKPLIHFYSRIDGFEKALSVVDAFWRQGVAPDASCFGLLLRECTVVADAVKILGAMLHKDIPPDSECWVALMRVCARDQLEESADLILKYAGRSGCVDAVHIWFEIMRVKRRSPEVLMRTYLQIKKRGMVPTVACYILLLRAMREHTRTPGDAATLHAELFFREALEFCRPFPKVLYSELLDLYAKHGDEHGLSQLSALVNDLAHPPPPRFTKHLKKAWARASASRASRM